MVSLAQELKTKTVKELMAKAKKAVIIGWHSMRKDDLIKALVKHSIKHSRSASSQKNSPKKQTAKPAQKKKVSPTVSPSSRKKEKKPEKVAVPMNVAPVKRGSPKSAQPSQKKRLPQPVQLSSDLNAQQNNDSQQRIAKLRDQLLKYRHLSGVHEGEQKDQLVLIVRDPFWLHVYWELSAKLVDRARAAMGAYWHTAKPIIRLFRLISDGLAQPRREHIRDIMLRGAINNWYIDVSDPPATFQVEIGYLSSKDKFFQLASSNFVETPENQVSIKSEPLDGNWLDVSREFERIYRFSGGAKKNTELQKVFEEQFKRPASLPNFSKLPVSHGNGRKLRESLLSMDADIVIYGVTDPDVQLTIKNEPVEITTDGTFILKFTLPEKRHVYPIVATSGDGIETQTVILAIERNTKVLETVFREVDHED